MKEPFLFFVVSRFGRERWNEHVKLFAGLLNGIGIASVVGAFIAPLVNALPGQAMWALFTMGLTLHVAGQLCLRYYVGKD